MFDRLRRALAAKLLRAAYAAMPPPYPSTGAGRRLHGLRAVASGPNALGSGTLPVLRSQSRQAERANPIAASGVDLMVTHAIGTGLKPHSLCPDPATREALQTLWFDWVEVSDADGVLDFYGQQALAVREWGVGGECFARLRPRLPKDGLPVPLQVQLLEPELVPVEYSVWDSSAPVHQGIERDALGRRTAFWMYRSHPGDPAPGDLEPGTLVRVPASDVLHLYHPTRAGQLRGVPALARNIVGLHDTEQYQDAERVRKKTAAMRMGAIIMPEGEDDGTPQMGEGAADADGVAEVEMEPGTMLVLDKGGDVKWFDPADVGGSYEAFLRWQYRAVAVSMGVLAEELTGDFSTLNDRTYRAAFNTFKRRCRMWQHNIVAVQFCTPVWRRFIDMALVSGAITRPAGMSDRDLYRVAWTPDRWEYINPLQDVRAIQEELDAGLTSRSRAVSERGEDVEAIDRERQSDALREQRLQLAPIAPPAGSPGYRVTPPADPATLDH